MFSAGRRQQGKQQALELGSAFARGVLRVVDDLFALRPLPVLLVIDPFLGRHVLFAAVLLELPVALLFEAHLRLRSPALYSQCLWLFVNLSVTLPGIDDEEVLFGSSGVGVVDQ